MEEKHLSACPDLSCAHLGGHLNLYAHFLETHYTPRPAQPALQAAPLPNASTTETTTAAGTAEAEEAAKGVKEREEEEKERKKERAVAEAGAFLQWLRDHGVHTVTVDRGELHPTAAVLQEQVCGFVAVFQATEGTAALAACLSEDDIASVYAYTLETEMYRRVCTCARLRVRACECICTCVCVYGLRWSESEGVFLVFCCTDKGLWWSGLRHLFEPPSKPTVASPQAQGKCSFFCFRSVCSFLQATISKWSERGSYLTI